MLIKQTENVATYILDQPTAMYVVALNKSEISQMGEEGGSHLNSILKLPKHVNGGRTTAVPHNRLGMENEPANAYETIRDHINLCCLCEYQHKPCFAKNDRPTRREDRGETEKTANRPTSASRGSNDGSTSEEN